MLGFTKKKQADTWLFAGLGNPGDKYAGNRHNIGFMAADRIARDFNFPAWRAKFQGRLAEGNLDGKKIILLKPETYMNNSGQSVAAAAKFYKIAPDRIFIFHDEIDLAPGKVRVKKGGGNAGHNGLRSIQDHLGTPDFWRVRLGVGRPVHGEVHDYVLSDFSKQDKEGLDQFLETISKYSGLLLESKDNDFMTNVAQDTKKI